MDISFCSFVYIFPAVIGIYNIKSSIVVSKLMHGYDKLLSDCFSSPFLDFNSLNTSDMPLSNKQTIKRVCEKSIIKLSVTKNRYLLIYHLTPNLIYFVFKRKPNS